MNEVPPTIFALIFCLCFIFIVAVSMFSEMMGSTLKKSKKSMSLDDWDMIPFGVIETPKQSKPAIIRPTPKLRKTVERSAKPVPSPFKPKPLVNPIFECCVETLVNLGYAKRRARAHAENIFELHNPKTVEEFITLAFAK